MLKTSILNHPASLINSLKSNSVTLWTMLLTLVPLFVFFIMLFFEAEIIRLIQTFYPPTPEQGNLFYSDMLQMARHEVLWFGFFFLLAFFLMVCPSAISLHNFVNFRANKGVYYMMLITVVFFLTTVLITFNALQSFPNSSDEYAYLFQGEMFSEGKLWARAHDLPDFFYVNNVAQHDGILVSRFPPGWPLFLGAAIEIGMNPALVNPLLGIITLVVFYFFSRKYYGHLVAVWGLLALALTGFYILNSASFFSHVSCLLVTLLFVYNIYLYRDKNNLVYGLLAGFFLGCVIIIRYYTAVLIFIPFFVYLLMQYRVKAIYLFIAMGIGSLPCLAYLLWYNYSITGNALVPVTVWAYPAEQLGFVKGHTFLKGIEHLIRRTLMFFYWSSPGLLVLYLVFLWRKIKNPAERFLRPEDYAFILLIIGYFFYYQIGGNQYGPRFLFEAFPFLVLLVVSKVIQNREKWATAVLLASIVLAIVKIPFIVAREKRVVDQRQNVYDLVNEMKITNAVVFVSSSTSPIRPMPADDLTRNDPRFVNDVLYALEIPQINQQLLEYYSDRSFYKYVREPDAPEGALIRIR